MNQTAYTKEYISRLIDRFMSGESSIEEEAQLASYFRHARQLPAEWEDYRQLFAYFDSGMSQSPVPRRAKTAFSTAMRRWTVAAGIAAVVAGGAMLLLRQPDAPAPGPQLAVETAAPMPAAPVAAVEKAAPPSRPMPAAVQRKKKPAAKKPAPIHPETPAPAKQLAANLDPELVERLRREDEVAQIVSDMVAADQRLIDAALVECGFQRVLLVDGSIGYYDNDEQIMIEL